AKSQLGGFLAKVGSSAWGAAKHYASKAGGFLARMSGGIARRARDFLKRKPPSLCNCFAAGTLVWSAAGPIPIDQIEPGALVLTMHEVYRQITLQPVLAVIPTVATALVELLLRHESGRIEKVDSADEHPFWVEGRGWVQVDALAPG